MLIELGVASKNRTDKFWHTGSTEEYISEEFDGWGFMPMLEFGDLIFKLFWMNATFDSANAAM